MKNLISNSSVKASITAALRQTCNSRIAVLKPIAAALLLVGMHAPAYAALGVKIQPFRRLKMKYNSICILMLKRFLLAGAVIAPIPAHAGLVGTEVSLRTLAQSTPSSTPFITSFERSVIVSATNVEYPDVASLFNPGSSVPPGFARSLVDVAIDVGNDYITIDFDNAGRSRYASGYENTYIFKFDSPAIADITSAEIDTTVTSLGLSLSDVRFAGNELFINVESLSFNASTFARINLIVQGGPPPVPEPETYALMLAGLGLVGFAARRRRA